MKHLLLIFLLGMAACVDTETVVQDDSSPGDSVTAPELASVYGKWNFTNKGTTIPGDGIARAVIWDNFSKYIEINRNDTINVYLQSKDLLTAHPDNQLCWYKFKLNWQVSGDEFYFDQKHTVIDGYGQPRFSPSIACNAKYEYGTAEVQMGHANGNPIEYWPNTYNQWYLDENDNDKLVWEMRSDAGWKIYMYFERSE